MIFSMSAKKQSSLLFDVAKRWSRTIYFFSYQRQLIPSVSCKNKNILQSVGARARSFLEVLTEKKMLVVWRSHRN